jgi:hypothetical protein
MAKFAKITLWMTATSAKSQNWQKKKKNKKTLLRYEDNQIYNS